MARGSAALDYEKGGPALLWERLLAEHTANKKGQGRLFYAYQAPNDIDKLLAFVAYWSDGKAHLLATQFPETYKAALMYHNWNPGSMKWYVEAMIMGKAPLEVISAGTGHELSVTSIAIYRRLFFDVTPHLDDEGWMSKYIWSTAGARTRCNYFDLVWKLVAYREGYETFRLLVKADSLPKDLELQLFKLVSDMRKRQVLANVATLDIKPEEIQHGTLLPLEMAWNDRSKDQGSGDTGGVVAEVSEALTSVLELKLPKQLSEGIASHVEHVVTDYNIKDKKAGMSNGKIN